MRRAIRSLQGAGQFTVPLFFILVVASTGASTGLYAAEQGSEPRSEPRSEPPPAEAAPAEATIDELAPPQFVEPYVDAPYVNSVVPGDGTGVSMFPLSSSWALVWGS